LAGRGVARSHGPGGACRAAAAVRAAKAVPASGPQRRDDERGSWDSRGGSISRGLVSVREPADHGGLAVAGPAQEVGEMIVLRPALGAFALHAQEDREATQRRVTGRRVGVTHRTVVFPVGAVAAVVLAVFDRGPVFAHGGEELGRRGRGGRTTGQAEDDGDRRLDRGALPDVALDAEQLRSAGEVRGERLGRSYPDPAPFAAAVIFVVRFGVGRRGGRVSRRGKNRPAVAGRRVFRGWAGCLWRGRGSRRLSRKPGTARERAGSARHRR